MTSRPSRTLLFSACVLTIAMTFAGPVAATETAEAIDELMTSYQTLEMFNGTVLVATDGRVIFSKGYGFANMEWEIPNRPNTKFRLGSITKQFTSMLIMQLIESEKLSLEATVSDLLSYYRSDTGSQITVHHLLSHTSGLPNYTALPGFMAENSRRPYGVEEFVTEFCSGDLEFEPGSTFRYSNSGYFVLGAIIEQIIGEPYEKVLADNILAPLDMEETGYDLSAPIIERRAAGYEKRNGGLQNARYLDMTLPYAAGALYSTTEDLLLWDQALYTDTLLSDRWKAKMFEPNLSDYAYGWGVRKAPIGIDETERTVVAHTGGINGFNTLIARVIEDRHLVILLNNTGGTRLRDMQVGILDILYGRDPAPPKPAVIDALAETLESGGAKAAIARYLELKEQQPDEYEFGEGQLNTLCYQVLDMGDVDGAIEVCKLAVEEFPESSNPYDSLGEVYMAAGENELAIFNYAKSLELNPGNTNAVRQLMILAGITD